MHGLLKITIALLLIVPNLAFSFDKPGTTAATFLQIIPSSRLASMGGAGVAFSGGPEMLAINPAAVKPSDNLAASFSYLDWFAGLNHQTLAVTAPVTPDLRLGFHTIYFGGDDFEQTTLDQPDGNGIMVDYGDIALGGSAIMTLTDRFTVGVTGKYIRQNLFNTHAQTIAFDIGTMLVTSLDGFSIGMAMTNLGGDMQLGGRDLIMETSSDDEAETRLHTSSWPLPLTFQTGIAWRLLGNDQAFWANDSHGLTIVADGKHLNEGVTTVHFGAEYNLRQLVFLRGGRTLDHDTEGWAFGAGIRLKLSSMLVEADFAYADLGALSSVKRVTIGLSGAE
ncbi:hypothetical protein BMS3Bbin04_00679 [bacterium BMS3Bbin04]|nr:hypothetical protein BMS3Bbin04_00679 [bacterium BMS3Bbin04]